MLLSLFSPSASPPGPILYHCHPLPVTPASCSPRGTSSVLHAWPPPCCVASKKHLIRLAIYPDVSESPFTCRSLPSGPGCPTEGGSDPAVAQSHSFVCLPLCFTPCCPPPPPSPVAHCSQVLDAQQKRAPARLCGQHLWEKENKLSPVL